MTTTATETLQKVLDRANPSQLGAALQQVKLGTVLAPLKKTFTGLTAAAAHDLTDAAHGDGLPALSITTLRVTGGAAAAGDRQVSDAGGTPSTTVATLSDDGKTITFEANVTDFVVTYVPRSTADLTAEYAGE